MFKRERNPIKAGLSYHPTMGLHSHLNQRHGISGQDLINEDEFIHRSSKGEIIQRISLTGPLVNSVFCNIDRFIILALFIYIA